jgi:hypothetical protein
VASYASANAATNLANGTLAFTYTIQNGQTDSADLTIATTALGVNSGAIKDLAGNDAVLTLNAGFDADIVVDANRPTVAITSPISGGYINATEANSALIITGTTTGVVDGTQVSVAINGASSTATVTGGVWSVTVSSATLQSFSEATIPVTANVSDAAGNAATQANASFVYDITSPTVSAVAFDSSTNELTISGTDFTNATFDPSKITWDIDGQATTNPDYTFPGGSVSSIVNNTTAKILLSSNALKTTTGFTGSTEDNLDLSAAVITDLAGNSSAATSNLQITLKLYGTDNSDNLFGGSLSDLLSGGFGTDQLYGNGGVDVLIGGGSNDTLVGGSGADVYVFADILIGEGSVAGDASAFGGIDFSVGVDTVNFIPTQGDIFRLDELVFGEMGDTGPLAGEQFKVVTSSSTVLTGLNTAGHGAIAYDNVLNKLYFVQASADATQTLDSLVLDGKAIHIANIVGNDITSAASFIIA